MKLARLAWLGGFGLIGLGCAERAGEMPADTAAMMPGTPPAAEITVFEVREASPGLLAEATFRPADAQRVVLTRFPNGIVVEATIDRDRTELIYTYRVRDTAGETHTVKVNARTGIVIDTVPR